MTWVIENYDMSVFYHPSNVNVVADILSQLSIGSVSRKDDKKELVRDIHRLSWWGVQLGDSTNGRIVVHSGSKSSFLDDMTTKQGLNPTLVKLMEAVLKMSTEGVTPHVWKI